MSLTYPNENRKSEEKSLTYRIQCSCQEEYGAKSCTKSGGPREKLYCDPVGEHIILLRDYYRELSELLFEMKNKEMEAATQGEPSGAANVYKERPIPEYPNNYPFSDKVFCKNKPRIKFKGRLSKDLAEKEIYDFVGHILAQTGFYVNDPESDNLPLQYLTDITDTFLKKFVNLLQHNKNSFLKEKFFSDEMYSEVLYESNGLWDPLETTLQDMGLGGIDGLHTFYYEQVVKKHDVLLNQCLELHKEYHELL